MAQTIKHIDKKQASRSEISANDKWHVEDIYENDTA